MTGPVASIAEAVRTGRRTARRVVEEYLESARALNPDLNAFTELDADGALRSADRVDAGPRTGALCGVPIALKDLIDHSGHVTTAGSAFHRHEATVSATVVDRLEASGAIIMGRTGLHEFAYGFSSENPWFGPVRNPWDLDTSPGGSSGGSASAVAAGVAPAALGTDTGGSVRVPAALCGIVGLKVTHGRIPLTGVFPLAGTLDTVGPLAITTGDARLLYEAMKGLDPADPWSVPAMDGPLRSPPIQELRIAIPEAWMESVPISGKTRRAFDRFVAGLRRFGPSIEPVEAPGLAPDPIQLTVVAGETAGVHRKWFADPSKTYGPDLRERLAPAMEITLDEYTQALRWRAGRVQAARSLFTGYDLAIMPTVGHPRKQIGVDTIRIGGEPVFYREVFNGFTSLVNLLGCPSISLPTVYGGTPPFSVQLMAPWWREDLLLDTGEALERAGLVRFRPPPAARERLSTSSGGVE